MSKKKDPCPKCAGSGRARKVPKKGTCTCPKVVPDALPKRAPDCQLHPGPCVVCRGSGKRPPWPSVESPWESA